jgi:predicted CXXCH cytochrome family protein
MSAGTRQNQFGRRAIRAMGIFAILSVLAVGCSVRTNYKTLSFFFDGVPDPNAPVKATPALLSTSSQTIDPMAPSKLYRHKPFADGKCTECHTADKKQLVTVKAELCVRCHQTAVNQYAVMHVPVATGQCLWCHEPHESDSAKLLKTTATRLCLQCHDQALLPSDKPHQSDEANCLECHVGHGSPKPSLLRVDNPTLPPIPNLLVTTTQPSPDGGGGQ